MVRHTHKTTAGTRQCSQGAVWILGSEPLGVSEVKAVGHEPSKYRLEYVQGF
jgi:hypothetical protein